ncbi:MAG: hypothetical protein O3B24_07520 [Verrucomicrobia bacterium]|nr:hypothetical protein [Verrucomicrobiota bacterium]
MDALAAAPPADGTLPDIYYQRMAELAAAGGFAKPDAEWRSHGWRGR